ncbi:phytol kinase [Rubritalea squalenifaciens DSM 18772]|uniref:Phytol kinase n=1 Tax=Rubritalea squalenifaciens DSM 18772 TaxID=1123071 RepID=A0A1M6HUV5_9BACT|nr:hypothetical protein [Rubritalea squalenifaciens]SHJ25961.1 phytol kinase [Rubritalea squalenifaciens DSM 18772]
MNPWLAILVCTLLLGALLAITARASKSNKVAPETARKMVHVGMGLICLTFPWIFSDVWPVLVLGGMAITGLIAIRYSRLRNSIGSGLFAVSRHSLGEILFPIGVAWVFSMSKGNPVTYIPPILLLTIADTAGAIAGTRWGKHHFNAAGSVKSIEGSSAFAIAGFLSVAAPLFLFSTLSAVTILSLSTAIAIFTMAVEGATGHGADNILLPVGSYFLIDYYLGLEHSALWLRVIALVVLLVLLLVLHKRHALNGAAILTAMLFGFAAFMLGGPASLLSGLALFIVHLLVQRTIPKERCVKYSIDIIFAFALPSLFWLAVSDGLHLPLAVCQLGFISSLCASVAMLHAGTMLFTGREGHAPGMCLVKTLFVAAPALLIRDLPPSYLISWCTSTLVMSLISARVFYCWRGHPHDDAPDTWWKVAILSLAASALTVSLTQLLCS